LKVLPAPSGSVGNIHSEDAVDSRPYSGLTVPLNASVTRLRPMAVTAGSRRARRREQLVNSAADAFNPAPCAAAIGREFPA
jgi:hypothetical protein